MESQYIDPRSLTEEHISSCHESEHLLYSSRQEKKRMMQAQHRATIARLIKNVKNIVWSDEKRSPTKCQILIEAKKFLQQQEEELVRLLKLKELFQLGDNGPRNLEEVKQEFRKFYYTSSSPSDLKSLQKQECHVKEVIPTSECEQNLLFLSSPNVVLQEGQTINIWVMKRPVVTEETSFPLFSKAFSCLWDSGQQKVVIPFVKPEQMSFSRQKSEDLVQTELENNCKATTEFALNECFRRPGSMSTDPDTSQQEHRQNTCDMAFNEEDYRLLSLPSQVKDTGSLSPLENESGICRQGLDLMKATSSKEPVYSQETSQNVDYSTLFLRCMETLDEEDF